MIIIERNANLALIQTLKELQLAPADMTAICFQIDIKQIGNLDFLEILTSSLKQASADSSTRIYLGEDNLVTVLVRGIGIRGARKLAICLCVAFGLPVSEEQFDFYDLTTDIRKLLAPLEELQTKHDAQKAEQERVARQMQQEASLVKRRHSILDSCDQIDTQTKLQKKRECARPLEVMTIEDDAFSRRLVENALSKDFHVTSVGEMSSAFSTYISVAPDILFLDINLPDVNGHELLEKIIHIDPDAFVVMLSGNADHKNVEEALKRGAKGFVAKPFTPEKLRQYIQRCPSHH